MNDQHGMSARLRYTAAGALATLAVVGAIAGTVALAASPRAKTPTAPIPTKTHVAQPGSSQPFLNDVAQLVNGGTISAAEGRFLDGEIRTGRVDTGTLASDGFTPSQLQAVQTALGNTKRALASTAPRTPK